MFRKALFSALVVFFAVLATTVSYAAASGDYVFAPDDEIVMNVWQEKDLSGKQMTITPEGNVTIPYINNLIHAAGLTQQELTKKIAEEYVKADILKDPKVEVSLLKKHETLVWVFGEVQKSGAILFKEGTTVTTAIAQAGSYTQSARLEAATLTRKGANETIALDLRKLYRDGDRTQDIVLQEGDVIHIPEDTFNRYYVLGEVRNPGLYFLKDNASALSAVSQAGGPTDRGSMKGTMVVRGDTKNPQRINVDLNKIAKGNVAEDVKLQAGDVIYVPETSKPDWQKISQIINVITSVGLIRRYGIF